MGVAASNAALSGIRGLFLQRASVRRCRAEKPFVSCRKRRGKGGSCCPVLHRSKQALLLLLREEAGVEVKGQLIITPRKQPGGGEAR